VQGNFRKEHREEWEEIQNYLPLLLKKLREEHQKWEGNPYMQEVWRYSVRKGGDTSDIRGEEAST